jgi:hypothetical protein
VDLIIVVRCPRNQLHDSAAGVIHNLRARVSWGSWIRIERFALTRPKRFAFRSLAAFLKPDLTPPERAVAQVEGWILGAPCMIRVGKERDGGRLPEGVSSQVAGDAKNRASKPPYRRHGGKARDQRGL